MTDEDFRKTRIKGEKAQARAIEWLKGEHPTIRSVGGDVSGYDLIDDNGYKVEVKFDSLSENTGNVAIEFSSMDKPSGIEVTIANDWLHIFKYQNKWVYVLVPVSTLRAFIRSNEQFLPVTNGGFKNYSKMILIPKNIMANNFGVIDIV